MAYTYDPLDEIEAIMEQEGYNSNDIFRIAREIEARWEIQKKEIELENARNKFIDAAKAYNKVLGIPDLGPDYWKDYIETYDSIPDIAADLNKQVKEVSEDEETQTLLDFICKMIEGEDAQ